MSSRPDHAFRARAILWLQNQLHLQTSALSTHAIEDEHGRARLEAYATHSRRASDLWFLSLCLLIVAAFFAMIGSRADVQSVRPVISAIQWVGLVGGVVCGIAGAALYRRSRETILVEIRTRVQHDRPIERDAIECLRRDADGLRAWMISEIPYTPEGLVVCRAAKVRCLLYHEGRFEELTPDAKPVDENGERGDPRARTIAVDSA